MKFLAIILAVGSFAVSAHCGDVYVPSYTDHSGNYHDGYHRTTADGNAWNNYSTQGNYNPYTGKEGTVNPNSPSHSGYGTHRGYNYGY